MIEGWLGVHERCTQYWEAPKRFQCLRAKARIINEVGEQSNVTSIQFSLSEVSNAELAWGVHKVTQCWEAPKRVSNSLETNKGSNEARRDSQT
ncbi:hypothetical protein AVEN_149048-1 [Araneus ventricosus]|uniref:Uncharacterized protein n=1 Tax=Araneus ventricosus TaxID=182803 RepID=A0A4Y2NIK4_ARAVE|nr:hypothetical protein AVEN_149048-1 [Araneus ventricosus]